MPAFLQTACGSLLSPKARRDWLRCRGAVIFARDWFVVSILEWGVGSRGRGSTRNLQTATILIIPELPHAGQDLLRREDRPSEVILPLVEDALVPHVRLFVVEELSHVVWPLTLVWARALGMLAHGPTNSGWPVIEEPRVVGRMRTTGSRDVRFVRLGRLEVLA